MNPSGPPFSDLRDRYVRARCRRDLDSHYQFQLFERPGGAEVARVAKTRSTPPIGIGETTRVFLIRLSGSDVWMASLVPERENPWLTGEVPTDGEIVEGQVARFDGEAGAIVSLDDHGVVDAYIGPRDLPEGRGARISATLSIGDRLRGYACNVDLHTLRLDLDIASLRRDELTAAREARESALGAFFETADSDADVEDASAGKEEREPQSRGLEGVRLLLVDNDSRLRAAMAQLVHLYSGQLDAPGNKRLRDICHLIRTEFASDAPPTHVLLDHALGERGLFGRAAEALKSYSVPVAVFSGDGTAAREAAIREGFGFLLKPMRMEQLINWCQDPRPAEPAPAHRDDPTASLWGQDSGLQALREQISYFLEDFTRRQGFAAGFWFRGTQTDRFELRKSTIAESQLPERLRHLEARCQFFGGAEGKVVAGRISSHDPAHVILETRPRWTHFCSIVVHTDNALPRAMVMLSEAQPTPSQIQALENQSDFVALMVSSLLRAEYHEGVEAFATQGRLAAGTVHEIRNRLQGWELGQRILSAHLGELAQAVDLDAQPWLRDLIDGARDSAAETFETLQEVTMLAREGLDGIRPIRRRRLNVNESLSKVVRQMRRVADVEAERLGGQAIAPRIAFSPMDDNLHLSVYGTVVEQALINLIDNALHFVRFDGTGLIKITVRIEKAERGDLRLVILVSDNGDGVSAANTHRLFEPRRTARGRVGTGLGLYVSRNMLRMEEGDLRLVTSVRWSGTTFAIYLPMMIGPMDDFE